jgi:hypothetical protein
VTRRGARLRTRYSGATAATIGLQTHDASDVAAAFLRIASRKRGVVAAIQATQSAAANSPALTTRLANGVALDLTTTRDRLPSESRARRDAAVLAVAAGGALLLLLGHAAMQLPLLVFASVTLSGLWVGIASLFSP